MANSDFYSCRSVSIVKNEGIRDVNMGQTLHGMPMCFEAAINEYRHARDNAVVFDLSRRAKVLLIGPEATMFLHNLCTNEVRNLKPGEGCETFFTTAKAKIVAHVFVTDMTTGDETSLLLDTEPGQGDVLLSHLDHYLISEQVEIADRTEAFTLFHLCGPTSEEIIDGVSLPSMKASRNDRLGLPGFDAFISPGDVSQLHQALLDQGAKKAGGQAFEWLRVEAGIPVFGLDMDDNRFVMEVGRTEQAISFTKGCFLGQEPIVMARDRGQVNRRFVGIRFEAGDAVPPGTAAVQDGEEVGRTTSSILSPVLQCPIALAYLKRGYHEPGTKVSADGREGVVCSIPFVC